MRSKLGFVTRQERRIQKTLRPRLVSGNTTKWSTLMNELKYYADAMDTSFADSDHSYNLCALARQQWKAEVGKAEKNRNEQLGKCTFLLSEHNLGERFPFRGARDRPKLFWR